MSGAMPLRDSLSSTETISPSYSPVKKFYLTPRNSLLPNTPMGKLNLSQYATSHTHYFHKVNFEITVPSTLSSPQRPLSPTTHTNFYALPFPCAFCMSCQCHTPRCIHLKLCIIRYLTINNAIKFTLFTVCTT
jgi:hypothetical protein